MYDSKITFVFEMHNDEIEGGFLSSLYRLIRSNFDFWHYYLDTIAWYDEAERDVELERGSHEWYDLYYFMSDITPDTNLRQLSKDLDSGSDVLERVKIEFEYENGECSVEYFEGIIRPLKRLPYWRLASVEHTTIR